LSIIGSAGIRSGLFGEEMAQRRSDSLRPHNRLIGAYSWRSAAENADKARNVARTNPAQLPEDSPFRI
jgi:hypothetical protein